MQYFVILLLFLLANCSGYTVASLTSNIATYSATGKTNSDHAISYVTGRDCRLTRALSEKKYCEDKKNSFTAEAKINENLNEDQIIKNFDVAFLEIIKKDSNLILEESIVNIEDDKKIELEFVEKIVDSFYYGSLTWAENQLKKGAKVSDKIGLTEDLAVFIEKTFTYYFY
jgi:hypothetical protein